MKFPELVEGYIGPNPSHARFKSEIANEKIFIYLVSQGKEGLLRSFREKIESMKNKYGDDFSIGMVTKGISKTQFQGMNIPHNEARLTLTKPEDFWSQVYAKAFAEVHRIFVAYLIDLFAEIARVETRILRSKKELSFERILEARDFQNVIELLIEKQKLSLSHADLESFSNEFSSINLPVIPPEGLPDEELMTLDRKFRFLWSTRNIIEHNRGIVNDLYLKVNPDTNYKVGDQIVIGLEELGSGIAAVEFLGENINKRAVQKYKL